ncbi:MAG: 2-C-methyl-D-erythritol 2,4-cyclodiphosphate synthase [bacterium]|nr:2-C-methyl-D-erythritol 2,4-cyclodiphosphate synthase [bacterium]
MRIGLGFDAHRLAEGRKLIIGGVEIDYHLGLDGHSDADVLAHAISDAILGALREGDIGKLFPPDDPTYEGANSIELLRQVGELATAKGYRVADIDSVISAEAPKLSKYRDQMRANIADALGIGIESVGIKATTTEGMGYEGRGEGISAQAVALLEKA